MRVILRSLLDLAFVSGPVGIIWFFFVWVQILRYLVAVWIWERRAKGSPGDAITIDGQLRLIYKRFNRLIVRAVIVGWVITVLLWIFGSLWYLRTLRAVLQYFESHVK
jgi:hypothetical protein